MPEVDVKEEIAKVRKAVGIFERLVAGLDEGTRVELAAHTYDGQPWHAVVRVQGGYAEVVAVEDVLGIKMVRDEGSVKNLGWLEYNGECEGIPVQVYAVHDAPGCVIRKVGRKRTPYLDQNIYEVECSG